MFENPVCSECGSEMEEGYVPDQKRLFEMEHPFWVKGKPEINLFGGYKVKGKQMHFITAYRCKKCGFIKLFAKAKKLD